jgi:hypothetical protein
MKDDPMKTKHFTSIVPPSIEKTIRLPLPAIEVRERSPFEKYRPNVVEIETTPDERRILNAACRAARRRSGCRARRMYHRTNTVGCVAHFRRLAVTRENRLTVYVILK